MDRLRRMGKRPEPGGPNPVLEGSVPRVLLGLSIPMVLAMFLVTAHGVVDMFWLGRLSPQAMAAVGVAFPVTFLLHVLAGAIGTGATSLCSRLIGNGEERQVRNLLLHVLLATLGVSALFSPLSLLALKPVITAWTRWGVEYEPEVIEGALGYGRIICGGAVVSLLPMAVNALFRGEGDTIFPFKIMVYGLALNIVLDPLLIFGWKFVPALGVAGAAVATLSAYGLALVIIAFELRNPLRKVRWDLGAWSYDPSLLKGLAAVSGPAALGNSSMPVSVWIVNGLVAPFGTEALAAFSAGSRLLSFVTMPALGLAMSMLIMVGQNHGAGLRDRVRVITWTAVRYSLVLQGMLALPLVLAPGWCLGIFTHEQAVIEAGRPLVLWAALARPILSLAMITAFWFQARGRGLAGMLPNTLLRIGLEPLGLWLGLRWSGELLGGWQGMALGDATGGLLCLAWLAWRLTAYVGRERAMSAETPAGS